MPGSVIELKKLKHTDMDKENSQHNVLFEDALDLTGFGKYNTTMLLTCCFLILAMYMDIFGFSVVLPAVACDMNLSRNEQAILSAVPLIGNYTRIAAQVIKNINTGQVPYKVIGVMISSYPWGLCADMLGRKQMLLVAMTIGMILNFAASLAPEFISLTIIKLLCAAFTASANVAGFVLLGESTPRRLRNRFIFFMVSATMFVQLVICLFALPVLQLKFRIALGLFNIEYRSWRLLLQLISIPGVLGIVGLMFLYESPKFLITKGHEDDALEIMKNIYCINNGKKSEFPVKSIMKEDTTEQHIGKLKFLRKISKQTLPLFQPPLLRNSLIIYYILLTSYMTSTGFTMWVPTMTNAYFSTNNSSGQTFCQVASTATSLTNATTPSDCDNIVQKNTLYAVSIYSAISGIMNMVLSFIVGPFGKKRLTLTIFIVSITAGIALLYSKIPILSIGLFFTFLYIALILGNINSYLVELNPTHLRGMATCISVIVARGFGFVSVQIIATLLEDHCQPMIIGYIILQISGGIVAICLPRDRKITENNN